MTVRISRVLAAGLTLAVAAGTAGFAQAETVTTNVSNPTPIAIPDSGSAVPSPVSVSGLRGTITDVTVTLAGFGHTYPSDVDVMLRAPGGQQVVLMSDSGAREDVADLTFVFNAASAATLEAIPLTSGSYRPVNLTDEHGGDAYPAAPAGVPTTDMTTLRGDAVSQNGTWELFVVDDAVNDSGTFARGWTLSITQDTFSTCAAEGFSGAKLTLCRQVCEIDQSPSRLTSLIKMYMAIYRSEPPCN